MEHLHSVGVTALSIAVMVLGFGFVIFWHELGHFLGARWAGIRVEQFAVGMGNAIASYRKGIGLRRGNTMKEFDRRIDEEIGRRHLGVPPAEVPLADRYAIAHDLGIGETEYRISWLPIGGYVKPTGQDDLRPSNLAAHDDPKSYAAAPVGRRMVMISAGVIMNVILAAILFFILFRFVGFTSMVPVVGTVYSNSPAAEAGLRGGDEVVELNDHTTHDFTKILMNTPLLSESERSPLVLRRDGAEQIVEVLPRKTRDGANMLALGLSNASLLRSIAPSDLDKSLSDEDRAKFDKLTIHLGESVVAINGNPVGDEDYRKFDAAIQNAFGRPIELTLSDAKAKTTRNASFTPVFAPTFDQGPLMMLGTCPRVVIKDINDRSPAKDRLAVGDIVLSMKRSSVDQTIELPTLQHFVETTLAAGKAGETLDLRVLRDGKAVVVAGVPATMKLPNHAYGLGVALEYDADHAVAAGGDGPIMPGTTITSIAGQPVATWFDVQRILTASPAVALGPVEIGTLDVAGKRATIAYALTADDLASVRGVRYAYPDDLAAFAPWEKKRQTDSALTAVAWGVGETRDMILQTYLTIRRVVGGSVPASNMSGPLGIFQAGTKFAQRGAPWFIWFLALISANLAVVNFLPVPILDGWHFLSLLKEKITGRPLSERVQEVAQYVGLAMILSLIVFVTYNDIARLF